MESSTVVVEKPLEEDLTDNTINLVEDEEEDVIDHTIILVEEDEEEEEEEEDWDRWSEKSSLFSECYPPSLTVKELEEPIPMDDKIVVVGYYPVGAYFGTFRDAWGRSLPVPLVGRTVLCGYLQRDHEKKVEIELRLEKPDVDYRSRWDAVKTIPDAPKALAVMRRVAEYSKDILYRVKDEYDNEMDPWNGPRTSEYECRFFSVSDEEWYEGHRPPFLLQEDLFVFDP